MSNSNSSAAIEQNGLLPAGWIAVQQCLPNKDGNSSIACLCYDAYHRQVRVLVYNEYHGCWDDESGDDYYTDAIGGKVSHWMPLPVAPACG